MSSHAVEANSELSDFIKVGLMTDSERDAGFCSGADEDDLSGLHSPSASEDSVDVNVTAISSMRNKRKLIEPRKFEDLPNTRPLKKRRRFEPEVSTCDEESRSVGSPSPSPFRPWSVPNSRRNQHPVSVASETKNVEEERQPASFETTMKNQTTTAETIKQEEVLSRLREDPHPKSQSPAHSFQRRDHRRRLDQVSLLPPSFECSNMVLSNHRLQQEEPLSLVLRGQSRVPSHPAVNGSFERPSTSSSLSSSSSSSSSSSRSSCHHRGTTLASSVTFTTTAKTTTTSSTTLSSSSHQTRHQQSGQQRNYKNMTRERRIEANARERTRVHTISAAFDTLRRAIPAYSHNQKLSKLSVLRIACSYIMTLGKIIDKSEGESRNGRESLEACVDLVSRTIQTEGKLRKKKDD